MFRFFTDIAYCIQLRTSITCPLLSHVPNHRVLVAEDHPELRTAVKMALESAGYSVFLAVNGAEAVQRCHEYRPDLVLMDLMMPVMDGWEATRRLKEQPETSRVPIVAVSALAESQILEKLWASGFCAFVAKPTTVAHLLGVVKGCLARGADFAEWIDAQRLEPPPMCSITR